MELFETIGVFFPWVILAIIVLIILAKNIVIVQQSKAYVVERLGAFQAVWGVGMHFKIPFIERVAKAVSLKEQVVDFPPQPVITKDNVTMQIDTVLYFQITDPKMYTYGVERPLSAIENLSATTLRNIIGDLELDQSLTSRDHINTQMRAILDEATDPWGIKVNRVELKNIMPPRDIQESMEKQMRAERERREAILQAEGQKQSQILVAEGEKQSAILRADAAKQAAILEAEGQAEAILKVQRAMADSLAMLNESSPNDQVIKLKSLEAFQAAANGKATKIIIPSESRGLLVSLLPPRHCWSRMRHRMQIKSIWKGPFGAFLLFLSAPTLGEKVLSFPLVLCPSRGGMQRAFGASLNGVQEDPGISGIEGCDAPFYSSPFCFHFNKEISSYARIFIFHSAPAAAVFRDGPGDVPLRRRPAPRSGSIPPAHL